MENLWIYILLIFIFIVRAIAKNAQKQIDANKKSNDRDEEYISEETENTNHPTHRPLTWEDLFPSEPKQTAAPVVTKSKKKIKSPQPTATIKVPEVTNEEPAIPTPEMNITDDAYNNSNNSDLLPYGTEELRKAVIASEILARKF
ncbi:hypothetical protein [Coprobacter sp.]